ncbi:MAG TPA: hypothetical protein VNE71_03075 [Myxococcota bacterium]|nr:hypothetical protein [Myxococcota bacterium]
MNRLAAIALAAVVPLAAALICTGPPVVYNATGAYLYVEVVSSDGETFSGSLEPALYLRGRNVERIEIRRRDGSIQRFDRARLELLAKDFPDRENLVWQIDSEGLRAVPYSRRWKRSR